MGVQVAFGVEKTAGDGSAVNRPRTSAIAYSAAPPNSYLDLLATLAGQADVWV
jgi:hypothetical protein